MKLLLIAFTISSLVFPCTSFQIKTPATVAKNYDWHTTSGLWTVNLRNQKKKAFHLNEQLELATWKSQYGSVTLNQYGRELPNSGMNERGLVVEVLWLDDSVYPEASALPAISELQWVQYILDTSDTVESAIKAAQAVVVRPIHAKVHYFVCDPADCATFEYVNGKLVVHSGNSLPYSVLTNNTYETSVKYLEQFEGFGGIKPLPSGTGSLPRFARAAAGIQKLETGEEVSGFAFRLLKNVAQSDTVWNVVYQQNLKIISLKTEAVPENRKLDAELLDYSCKKTSLMADLNQVPSNGMVNSLLEPYSREKNLEFIKKGLQNLGAEFPEFVAQALATYPETLQCTE